MDGIDCYSSGHIWGLTISIDPTNPYASTSSELVESPRENRFLSGVKRSLLASIIAATACVGLVVAAKGIDWAIPGEGALNDAPLLSILRQGALVYLLITMISSFSAFAYYAGGKQLNAGVCVLVVFLSGIFAAWALSCSGFPSPRRLRMEHPPIYLSELLTYVVPFSVASAILTAVGSLRINKNPEANQ